MFSPARLTGPSSQWSSRLYTPTQTLSHQRGPEDCAGSGLRLPVRPPPLRGGAAPHRSPLLRGGAAVLLPQVLMGHVITLKLSIQEIEKKTHSGPLSDGRRVLSVTHGESPVIFCYFLFYLFNAFKKSIKHFIRSWSTWAVTSPAWSGARPAWSSRGTSSASSSSSKSVVWGGECYIQLCLDTSLAALINSLSHWSSSPLKGSSCDSRIVF